MIFEVNKEEFIRAIKPAVEVASKNTLKDFKYENLLTIKAEKDKIVLFAFGGLVSLIAPISGSNFNIDYNCEEEGSVTIYADDLMTFMQSLPKDYDKVKISLDSNQLKIVSASQKNSEKKRNSVRTMPIVSEIVRAPNLGKVFEQDVQIDREVFVKGMDGVIFAPAFEEKMYSYMCMLFEAKIEEDEQVIRFSAGTGGRFAIKDISGKHIIKNNQEAKIIFPKDSLNMISKLLSDASSPQVSVKSIKVNQKDDIAEHIMIEFDDMSLCIFGIEHFTGYPDLTKIIAYKYSNRVYSNLEDWKSIVKTIEGTKHRWNENIHNTEVVLDVGENVFEITPKTSHASPTFVDMVDIDNCHVKGEKIWFRCNSDYIREMVIQGGNKGKVQLNFESQALLEGLSDEKEKQKTMKPVLVKFPTHVDEAKDISDKFYMFFSVSTK